MKPQRKIDSANVEDILGLTSMQEGMLYHYMEKPESRQYFEQIILYFSGDIDRDLFREAWNCVTRENEMLRAVYRWEDLDNPIQIIFKDYTLPIREFHLPLSTPPGVRSFADIVEQDRLEGIDICSAPVRITICQYAPGKHAMLLSFHHIVFDGWSSGILLNEFLSKYYALAEGDGNTVVTKTKFKEYIKWLQARVQNTQKDFWSLYLEGFDTKTNLAEDYRKAYPTRNVESFQYKLDNHLQKQAMDFTVAHGITLASLIYSAWGILLQRYNNTNDVVFGTTVSGRPPEIKGIANMVGLFINTLPLRIIAEHGENAVSLCKKVYSDLKVIEQYSHVPLVDIKKYAGFNKAGDLFNTIVVIDNYPLNKKLDQGNTKLIIDSYSVHEITNYDLVLQVMEFNGIELNFHYNSEIYKKGRMENLVGHFTNILQEILSHPNDAIAKMEVIGEDEKRKLLFDFNSTAYTYPSDKTIQELFEKMAAEKPDYPAVMFETQVLTYKKLNEKANQLAWLLRNNYGVGRNTIVGLAIPYSLEMLIGIIAVIKAGGTCLPLDLTHPEERINTILEDSEAAILIQLEGYNITKNFTGENVYLNNEDLNKYSPENLRNLSGPMDIAFLIYTSGSTGKPKGAMLHHKGIINHLYTKISVLDLTENDVIGNNFSVNVVPSIWQILSPLILGGKLVVYPNDINKNPYEMFAKFARDGITVIELVPSVLDAYIYLLEKGETRINLPLLKKVALTSEPVKPLMVSKFFKWYDIELANCYGQTECCDDTLHYTIPVGAELNVMLIGKPSFNTKAYILNKDYRLQPLGEVGELCISGDGVSAGYWKRPHLTREKFVPNPYENGNILYRTGDLARWMEDGNVECLGRIDHQVKIKGNRVELDEIETCILKVPGITSCGVIARDDIEGDKYLCAYLVSDREYTTSELRNFLAQELPEHSIPTRFIRLAGMPLTANGKVDRKFLVTLKENVDVDTGTEYFAPRSQLEKEILAIWQDLLAIEKIGINDNFFDCGGHSLLFIKLQNRLKKTINRQVSLVQLLQYPTIRTLAGFLAKENISNSYQATCSLGYKDNETDIAIIGMSGRFPGASSIKEFWFNLEQGLESVSSFADDELEVTDETLINNPNLVKRWGALAGIDLFDASFFGITPKEAELMDPQQRFFMECAWEALEDAGYSTETFTGKTGVYAGMGISSYLLHNIASDTELIDSVGHFQLAIANDKDYLSTRTAYKLNLKGPSITVQTACSTSLAAVHLACQGLINNECTMALAGGVHIKIPQESGYIYEAGGNMGPHGQCRTFDADAKGSVMGNGVGVVVLKLLKDAISERDHIYAVIKGTALNNDGSIKAGYTAPSIEGQMDVITHAYVKAGVSPETIGYIETHGTGTELGDPVELTALSNVFTKTTSRKGFCALGSLKSNIGHLDVAAGVSGLIKTALVLKNKTIPPTLHFELPNPEFDFINSPFYVARELESWECDSTPRRAGVSSFGIGGTNVHAILEEAPEITRPEAPPLSCYLLPLSAKTSAALEQAKDRLETHLLTNPDSNIADVAYTLQIGRNSFPARYFFIAKGKKDIVESFTNCGRNNRGRNNGSITNNTGSAVIDFAFPDQIGTHYQMDYSFYLTQTIYSQCIDRCCSYLARSYGLDIKNMLFNPEKDTVLSNMQDISIDRVKTFILQYAMALLLMDCGVESRLVTGTGTGRYAALSVAHIIEPEDALRLIMDSSNHQASGRKSDFTKDIAIKPAQINYLSSTGILTKTGQEINLALEIENPEIKDILNIVKEKWEGLQHICLVVGRPEKEEDFGITNDKGTGTECQIIDLFPGCEKEWDLEILLSTLGELWLSGINIKWEALYRTGEYCRVSLPAYPFERKHYWVDRQKPLGRDNYHKTLLEKTPDIKTWFYFPVWRQSCLTFFANSKEISRDEACWLIFADNHGIGFAIWEHLVLLGHEAILVKRGSTYQKIDEHTFTIDPKNNEDYKTLIQYMVSEGRIIKYVVHSWSSNKVEMKAEPRIIFDELQYSGFYSLLYLTKAFIASNITHQLEMWVISSDMQCVNGDEILCAEKSTILAICKTIHQEHTNIFCHSIDLLSSDIENSQCTNLINDLLLELAITTDDITIAYRNNKRWVQDYERVYIDDKYKQNIRLRKKGTYLITGGLGEIGRVFADYLAKEIQANLVLTGRTLLPDRNHWEEYLHSGNAQNNIVDKINRLKSLEGYGSNIRYECVDVADEDGMSALLASVSQDFGEIIGIIHLAGITGTNAVRAINEECPEECQVQFNSKVYGIYTLERLFKNKKIDFCLVVSSLCAILGGLGSTAYAAANTFLDTYAQRKAKEGDFPLMSVNWEAWSSLHDKWKWLTLDKMAITPDEGVNIFCTVLSLNMTPRLIVSTGNLFERIQQWLGRNLSTDDSKEKKAVVVSHRRPGNNSKLLRFSPTNFFHRVGKKINNI